MNVGLIAPAALLICCAGIAGAAPIDWAEVHNLTVRGIDRLYNLDVDSAIATFDSVRRMAPGDPRGYFFGSMVHFWLYSLTRDEKEYQIFMDKSDQVITVCENLLDEDANDATSRFYLGGIYGYRGLAHQVNNSIFKAITEGRKGYLYLKEAVTMKPDLYDAQMGFGLFNYLVAKVPRSLSWVLSLVGFDGNMEGGIAMVRKAAEKGTYTRTEASYWLSQFFFAGDKREEAIRILDGLIAKYPGNSLFQLTFANWQLRLGNTDEALLAARKAVAINGAKRVRYGEEFTYSTLGGIYYARNDFVAARQNFQLFVRMVRSADYVSNWALYRLGVAQEVCGDRQAAIGTFKNMREAGGREKGGEAYWYRLGRERIREPLGAADTSLIMAENDLGRKDYKVSTERFTRVLHGSAGRPDLEAQALYGLAQVYFDTGDYADALRAGEQLVALKPDRELSLVPRGLFRLGETYEKLGNTKEALGVYERILEYDDYDFQESLEERAREKIGQLKSRPH